MAETKANEQASGAGPADTKGVEDRSAPLSDNKDVEDQSETLINPAAANRPIQHTFVDPAVDIADNSRTVEAGDGGSILRFNPVVTILGVAVIVFVTAWLTVHEPCNINTLGACSDSNIDRMDACTDSYTWVAATETGTCVGCVGDDCQNSITTEASCVAQCDGCSDTYHPHDHQHRHSDAGHQHDDDRLCPCPCPQWQAAAAAHCVRGSDGTVFEAAVTEEACTQPRTWTVDPSAAEIRHWNGTHFDGSHRGCPAAGSWFRTQHDVLDHVDWSAGQQLGRWSNWAVEKTNWLQVLAKNGFLLMLGWCVYNHGDVKLGTPSDRPVYATPVWLAMIFTTAMGVSLLLFSVAEPVSRLAAASAGITDAEAQAALAGNFHHFGLHAWCSVSVVGLATALAAHRWGLPLSLRAAFFPLLGRAIFGWLGDLIDALTLLTTFFGVAASLGFAAIQLNSGLHELHDGIALGATLQTVLVWLLMAAAAAAVVRGAGNGLRWLCAVCFCAGSALLACALLIGNPWYLLAVLTQSTGHYLQWLLTLGTDADAFAAPAAAENHNAAAASMAAAAAWSAFYWNWWVALAPAAGLFIARISKGRTVRQFVAGTLLAPVLYCFVWMAVFGGSAVELQRNAAAAGLAAGASDQCALVQSSTLVVGTDGAAATSNQWVCGECPIKAHVSACAASEACAYEYTHQPATLTNLAGGGSTLPSASGVALWFAVLNSFGELGGVLTLLSVVTIAGYFVTTAAAGAHVIDSVSSNGRGGSAAQRCFWAVLLAAATTGLLHAGGADAFDVMMRCAAFAGVPFMALLPLACLGTARALRLDAAHHGDHTDAGAMLNNEWSRGLLHGIVALPSAATLGALGVCVIAPFIAVSKGYKHACSAPTATTGGGGDNGSGGRGSSNVSHMLLLGLLTTVWLAFVSCVFIDWALVAHDSMWAVGWTAYIAFACATAGVRTSLRGVRRIDGSFGVDLVASVLGYPFVAAQIAAECDHMLAAAEAAPNTGSA